MCGGVGREELEEFAWREHGNRIGEIEEVLVAADEDGGMSQSHGCTLP